MRLDIIKGATEDLGGGRFAIVAGKMDKSELLSFAQTSRLAMDLSSEATNGRSHREHTRDST